MSKQEIDKMNKYDESNKNLNQSKLNPNLFYNGLRDNSKGNNINPVFINNVFINNFNNNNQNNNNNNIIENKNIVNLGKNCKNKAFLNSQCVYKKSIIKSNLNPSSNTKKNKENKTLYNELGNSKSNIEKLFGSPYKPPKGVETDISKTKKARQNNGNKQNNFIKINNQFDNTNDTSRNISQANNNISSDINNNFNSNMNQQNNMNLLKDSQNNQKNNFQINFSQIKHQQLNKFSRMNKNQINQSQGNENVSNIRIQNNNKINHISGINQSNMNIKNISNISNPLHSQTNKINQVTNQAIKNNINNQQVILRSHINNKNNKINQNSINYSFSNYKKAAMTGLKNLGSTSYLNSVLQLLGNIRNFASYFLNPKNGELFQEKLEKYPHAFVTHRLCFHLYTYLEKRGREIYTPDSYMCMLGNFNWVYKSYKERDPRMLIIYILNKLHEELIGEKSEDNSNIENNMKISKDRDAIINLGFANIMKYNKSCIFNYFSWLEIKETKCMNCSNELYSLLYFSTFELNIFEFARYKRLKSIKLDDCLNFYSIPKIKKKYCYFCKSYKEMTTTTQIYSSPNYFIFLLNLENNTDDEELDNINFEIEKRVNLGKYIENKSGPLNYELTGIVYLDKTRNKYCTLSCSPIDSNWYLYEDENVSLKNYDNFIKQKFNKNIYYKPCIMIYKGMNN